MKTRIVIICAAIIAIFLFIWLRSSKSGQNGSVGSDGVRTNEVLEAEPERGTTKPEVPSIRETAVGPTVAEGRGLGFWSSNVFLEQRLADWQAPIEFYGKCVDEKTNALSGVSIVFQWMETEHDEDMQTASTESDSYGLFSLHGKRGARLSVSFSKDGYYSAHQGKRGFNFALGPDILSPDPQNPVIFALRKKGTPEALVHIAGKGLRKMRDFPLADDGKPVEVSLNDGRRVELGQGDLRVEFRTGPPLENSPRQFSWECRVTVPGGGLLQTDEEFPFLAPENGYKEFEQWSVTAANWSEAVDRQYYVKLRDGSFGRVKLRVIGIPKRAFFRMESWLNPSGSRNLEPANMISSGWSAIHPAP